MAITTVKELVNILLDFDMHATIHISVESSRMPVNSEDLGSVEVRRNKVYLIPREDLHKAEDIAHLRAVIKDIGDFAHSRSKGPVEEDDLWEVRRMAYDAL